MKFIELFCGLSFPDFIACIVIFCSGIYFAFRIPDLIEWIFKIDHKESEK